MPNHHITQMAVEYLVAGQLCLKGYAPFLTWKNYPKVDIFCLNPINNRQVPIQVKTTRHHDQYFVPENVNAGDPVFVFVHINDGGVQYYVVPAANVAELAEMERQEYLQNHPHAQAEQPLMLSVNSIQGCIDQWNLLNLE